MGSVIVFKDRVQDWPDTGDVCCMGVAVHGPGGCTCWDPVCDIETQADHDGSAPCPARDMCSDCAYRKNSPERNGADGYAGDADELDHIVIAGKRFFCHQGVRKVLHYLHPCGMTVPAHPADYAWRFAVVGSEKFPIKADGSPADICGGWFKRRTMYLKSQPVDT